MNEPRVGGSGVLVARACGFLKSEAVFHGHDASAVIVIRTRKSGAHKGRLASPLRGHRVSGRSSERVIDKGQRIPKIRPNAQRACHQGGSRWQRGSTRAGSTGTRSEGARTRPMRKSVPRCFLRLAQPLKLSVMLAVVRRALVSR